MASPSLGWLVPNWGIGARLAVDEYLNQFAYLFMPAKIASRTFQVKTHLDDDRYVASFGRYCEVFGVLMISSTWLETMAE